MSWRDRRKSNRINTSEKKSEMWDDAGPDASYNNSQPKWLRQYVGCKYVLMTLLSNQHTSCFWGAAVAPFTQPGKWRLKTLRFKSLKNLKNVMSSWHGGKHPNIFNENHILPFIEITWKKNRFVSISWRLCYLIYPQFGMNKTTLVRLIVQKSSTSLREIHTLQIMWMFFQNHITYFPLCTGDGEISEPSTSTPPKFNMTTYLPRPMIFGI